MNVSSRQSFRWLTVGGLGHLRPAPGTWGSFPPVVVAGLLMAAGAGPQAQPVVYNGALLLLCLVFSIACVRLGDRAELAWGKDPSPVVADEVAGQSLALLFLPAGSLQSPGQTALTLAACFLLFRLLDIAKPWPARQIQSVPAGWGILLDDLVAGLYALAAVQVSARWLWP